MPIRPEERARYPKDWKQIRARILARAGDRCEGSPKYPDCRAPNGSEIRGLDRRLVVLTIGHLNHTPEDNRPENLKAWCQRCHLTYDAKHHAATARATRRKRLNNRDMFE